MSEEERSGQQATAWTVGQLRKALEGIHDDLPLMGVTAEGDEHVVVSAGPWAYTEGSAYEVGSRIAAGELKPSHFEIGLEYPDD